LSTTAETAGDREFPSTQNRSVSSARGRSEASGAALEVGLHYGLFVRAVSRGRCRPRNRRARRWR
jgi:hypothetical protein